MTNGTYAWTPWSETGPAHFFFDSPPTGMTVNDGYQALSDGVADFFVGGAHGWWGAHGQIDVAWVESHPVRTSFFLSYGCSVANLDYEDNFLSSVLYSETSSVVVAKGDNQQLGGHGVE